MNKGQCAGTPPTSAGFPVSSGLCQCLQPHPGNQPRSPGQSPLVTFTWSLFIDTKTSVSDLSFYFYLQSLNHHGSCSFCSFRSWPVRSPHLLPIFSVMLIRFTASMFPSSEMPLSFDYLESFLFSLHWMMLQWSKFLFLAVRWVSYLGWGLELWVGLKNSQGRQRGQGRWWWFLYLFWTFQV